MIFGREFACLDQKAALGAKCVRFDLDNVEVRWVPSALSYPGRVWYYHYNRGLPDPACSGLIEDEREVDQILDSNRACLEACRLRFQVAIASLAEDIPDVSCDSQAQECPLADPNVMPAPEEHNEDQPPQPEGSPTSSQEERQVIRRLAGRDQPPLQRPMQELQLMWNVRARPFKKKGRCAT